MNPDVQITSDRMYTRYGTFDKAIDAAIDYKHGHDRYTDGYIFWDAVIRTLTSARRSLGLEAK